MKKALCSFLAVILAISFSACKNDLPETTLQSDDQAGKNEVEATTKTASSHQAATSGKEEAVNQRLDIYYSNEKVILDYYRAKDKLRIEKAGDSIGRTSKDVVCDLVKELK